MDKYKTLIKDGILPRTQKEQSVIFGVKESTLNGWVNNDSFPEYAKVIVDLTEANHGLEHEVQKCNQIMQSAIPVEHSGNVLIVKLKMEMTAVYAGELQGNVIAECTEADNATYILDFIN